jgi:hypothetical protein
LAAAGSISGIVLKAFADFKERMQICGCRLWAMALFVVPPSYFESQ